MRAVIVLLCTLACDVRAEGFLSPGSASSTEISHAALLDALGAGGCGEPCARVLHSAVAAISNKSAGTVRLVLHVALATRGVYIHGSCVRVLCDLARFFRMCGRVFSRSSVPTCVPRLACLFTADLLWLRPAGDVAAKEMAEGRKAAEPFSRGQPGAAVVGRDIVLFALLWLTLRGRCESCGRCRARCEAACHCVRLTATARLCTGTPCSSASGCELLSAVANKCALAGGAVFLGGCLRALPGARRLGRRRSLHTKA